MSTATAAYTEASRTIQNSPSRVDWKKAVLAGIVGTLIFDFLGLISDRQLFWRTRTVGLQTNRRRRLPIGVLTHYGNGVVIAVIYAGLGWVALGKPLDANANLHHRSNRFGRLALYDAFARSPAYLG
ncbi:hypothetical protein MJD09_05760 [bacterium]|nr:hypothetical protein [bacterium]